MIRSLFALVLTLLCACLPRTTQSPTPGASDDTPSTPEQQVSAEREPAEPPPTWGHFAQPPPGVETATPPLAENKPVPKQGERRREAPTKDYSPRAEFEAEAPRDDGAAMGSAAAPRSSRSSSGAIAEKSKKEDRPGLGTSWGETRYSQVDEVPFARDNGSPSYTAAMHYNDAHGAYALAGGGSWTSQAQVGLGSALTMTLQDASGSALGAYRGNGRTVAVGENGQRYVIVVHNNTNERFEVVLSVDGLDVLDGREASYGKRGYLIDPYGTLEIEGFRQSADAVAAFRFGSVADSYASRTGSSRNVGVIGAAAFGERGYAARLAAYRERVASWRNYDNDTSYRRSADPFPGRYATPPSYTPNYNIAR